jgi:hypothetical protein
MSSALDRIIAALEAADCRQGRGWLCPAHDDRNASLSLSTGDDGRVLVKCFAGCPFEEIASALGLEPRDFFDGGEGGSYPPDNRATAQHPDLMVETYAEAKKLDAGTLRDLGISDYRDSRFPHRVLRIPYRDAEGNEPAVRIRLALSGGDRFLWRKGSKPCLYGLWRLHGCTVAGGGATPTPLVLVEGESDCHTLWHHGFCAAGLPGAGNWKEDRDAKHLEAFERIFVLIEPDKGGETVLGWLGDSSIRDRAWLIRLDGFGDVSALHLAGPDTFAVQFEAAMDKAEPWREVASRLETAERREAWSKCQTLAEDGRILDRLVEDAATAGVTGEQRTVKLIYLAATSRLLDRLASIVVKGQSSSGKSWTAQVTLGFLPPESYYEMTAASEHALIYDREPLRHRTLVIYEASGLESDKFSYIVRSLLSEGRLRYPTVVKRQGELETVMITREGPTNLITTTTALRLHQENETRLLSLASDESAEQTTQVLEALAEEDGDGPDHERWHALQRWLDLGDREVSIPFAKPLARLVPPVAVRLRRDFGSLLALVRAHALLHQATRERDDRGRIIATIDDDYAVVRELISDVISEGVEQTVRPQIRELVAKVRELVDVDPEVEVTQRQLANELDLDKGSISRRVRAALDGGYLVNREKQRGRPHRLVPGDPLPDDLEILPTPEQLRGCAVDLGGATPIPPGDDPPPSLEEVEGP